MQAFVLCRVCNSDMAGPRRLSPRRSQKICRFEASGTLAVKQADAPLCFRTLMAQSNLTPLGALFLWGQKIPRSTLP